MPTEEAKKVGITIISKRLTSVIKSGVINAEYQMTHRAAPFRLGVLSCIFLRMSEAPIRPLWSLGNNDRVCRVPVKARSSREVGMHRRKRPRGMEANPSETEIAHSLVGMGVT